MARTKVTVEKTNDVVETPVEDDSYVTVNLYYDGDKFKDPVQVGHNGVMYSVPRGKDVKVPWFIASILRESQEQDAKTKKMMNGLNTNFAELR